MGVEWRCVQGDAGESERGGVHGNNGIHVLLLPTPVLSIAAFTAASGPACPLCTPVLPPLVQWLLVPLHH